MTKRYWKGQTDYVHRYKLLKNHKPGTLTSPGSPIFRVVLGKKCNYNYVGLYTTREWHMPDLCLYYGDTRKESWQKISRILAFRLKKSTSGGMVVLDKGRRKKLEVSKMGSSIKDELKLIGGPKIRGL